MRGFVKAKPARKIIKTYSFLKIVNKNAILAPIAKNCAACFTTKFFQYMEDGCLFKMLPSCRDGS